MVQVRMLLPVVLLTVCGCASAPEQVTPAAELAARATEAPRSSTRCRGAERTAVCSRDGSCRCADSGNLPQVLGLDDPAWMDK
jgi:hypothetical protein